MINKSKILLVIFFIQVFTYSQTDEYGTYYNNGVLSGLGASNGGYASVPGNTLLNLQNAGTIETWVYLNQHNTSSSFIYEKGNSIRFGINGGPSVFRPFMDINGSSFASNGLLSIPLNRWVHLAGVFSVAGSATTVTFYVDGAIYGSPVTNNVVPANTADSVTIGGSRLSISNGVTGFVDEVRYWAAARTASQIAKCRFTGIGDGVDANLNSAITAGDEYSGLVASWTFNGQGTAVDESINNLNAYLRRGAFTANSPLPGQPVPYNMVCYFASTPSSYIKVPDNDVFDRVNSGSIDGWIQPINIFNSEIISKISTPSNATFRVFLNQGYLHLQLGSDTASGPPVFPGMLSHFAVTWKLNGSQYSVKFYTNGALSGSSIITANMQLNANPVIIGNIQQGGSAFAGNMDEIRVWGKDLTADEVSSFMFVSGRSGGPFINNHLLACWNFDGNLKNFSQTPGINGSFNTAPGNECRFSAYENESNTGQITVNLYPFPTVLNNRDSSFPGGFAVKAPYKGLLFGTPVYDTISIPGNVQLNNIQVFLSIFQPLLSSMVVTLKAPNGTEITLLNNSGGQGNSVHTILKDGSTPLANFLPPWSYTADPVQTMGNFNNSGSAGLWIIKVVNNNVSANGRLKGWGIRINNTLTALQSVSGVIPGSFRLYQNYPNPFNPSTEILFDLPESGNLKLDVFDMLGQEVAVLADEYKTAGSYRISFDASHLASGTYFFRLRSGSFSAVKKMILFK